MNVHCLKHLSHFVQLYGPLFTTSCFGFESMNNNLKSMIHGTRHIMKQLSFAIGMVKSLPNTVKEFLKEEQENQSVARLTRRLGKKFNYEFNPEESVVKVLGVGKLLLAEERTFVVHELSKINIPVPNHAQLLKFHRVHRKGETFYSSPYERCRMRNSYSVSFTHLDIEKFGSVCYFVGIKERHFAVIKLFETRDSLNTVQHNEQLVG